MTYPGRRRRNRRKEKERGSCRAMGGMSRFLRRGGKEKGGREGGKRKRGRKKRAAIRTSPSYVYIGDNIGDRDVRRKRGGRERKCPTPDIFISCMPSHRSRQFLWRESVESAGEKGGEEGRKGKKSLLPLPLLLPLFRCGSASFNIFFEIDRGAKEHSGKGGEKRKKKGEKGRPPPS